MVYVIPLNGEMEVTLEPADYESATVQDLYVLLNTAIDECPLYREFGINKDYLHMPVNIAKTLLTTAIVDAIEKFMPNLDVTSVDFNIDGLYPDTFQVYIEVTDNAS
jgi:hypothetical protein